MGTTTDYKEKYLKSFFKWQNIYENACQREKKLEEKLKITKEKLETIKTTATFGKLKGINADTPDNMRLKAIVTLVDDVLEKIKE